MNPSSNAIGTPPEADARQGPYIEKQVGSWEEAKAIFASRGPGWVFRGQSNSAYQLTTSYERLIADPVFEHARPPWQSWVESYLLREFKRGAHLYLHSQLPNHTLDWFALMQHYGTPTRLLDFTYSPYVTSFFALNAPGNAPSGAVWAVDGRNLETTALRIIEDEKWADLRQMITESDEPATFFSKLWADDMICQKFLELAGPNYLNFVLPVTGFSANERMMVQQGVFLMPSNIENTFVENLLQHDPETMALSLYKIVIPKEVRQEALADLQLMNITQASLFPGLEGYARSLPDRLRLQQNQELSVTRLKRSIETNMPPR